MASGGTNNNSNSQRKSPKQTRSKALVEAIYEATVRILPGVGSENITTKKVAEIAGVSIGSLYQYFPNKNSILEAVMDIAISTTSADVNKAVDQLDGKSLDEAISIMVDHVLGVFLDDKARMREVFRKAPELQRVPILFYMRQKVVDRLADQIAKEKPGLEAAEYRRMAFVSSNAVMGIVQTMLFDETQKYTKEELATELKAMIAAYFHQKLL